MSEPPLSRPRTTHRWRRVALNVGLPVVVGVAVEVWSDGAELLGWPRPLTAVVSIALVILAALVQVWRALRDDAAIATTDDTVNDLRIAMKDSLLPLATLLAELPNLTAGKRREHVKRAGSKATEVLAYLLLKDVTGVRANVFALSQDQTKLSEVGWAGHGDRPGIFESGRPGGDAALERVRSGEPLMVTDVRRDPPAGYSRSSAQYRSFIAVPIRSGQYAYGMLTVDSREPDAFTDTDLQIVRVVAEMLAIGFATAFPGKSRGTTD